MSKPKLIACLYCERESDDPTDWKDVEPILDPSEECGWTHTGVCPDFECREFDAEVMSFGSES